MRITDFLLFIPEAGLIEGMESREFRQSGRFDTGINRLESVITGSVTDAENAGKPD